MTNRIQQTFNSLKAKGEKALIPYIMAGDPSLDVTESLVLTLAEGGADLIELGVPFSDPIADGPVILKANQESLATGITVEDCIDFGGQVAELLITDPATSPPTLPAPRQ